MNVNDQTPRLLPTRLGPRHAAALAVLAAAVVCVVFLLLRSGSPASAVRVAPGESAATRVPPEPDAVLMANVDRDAFQAPPAPPEDPPENLEAKKRAEFLWLIRWRGFTLDDLLRRDFLVSTISIGHLTGTRSWNLTSEELRELCRRQSEERFRGRAGNLLQLPFVEDLDAEDLAWLEEKASALLSEDVASPRLLDAVAAMHALRLAGTYDRMNNLSPLLSLGAELVDGIDRPLDPTAPDAPVSEELREIRKKAAIVTLENLDVLGGDLSEVGIRQRLLDTRVDPEVRAALLRLYARAGGEAGAQYTIAEAAAGRPGAVEALAEVRSPSSTLELAGLAERSLASGQSSEVAEAALAALAGIGTVEAYEEFRSFLLPSEDLPEAERSRRQEIAARAFLEKASGPLVEVTGALLSFDQGAGLFGKWDSPITTALALRNRRKGTRPSASIGLSAATHERLCDGLRGAIVGGKLGSQERDYAVLRLADWARESDIPFVLGELNSLRSPQFAENVRESFRTGRYRWLH